MRRMLQYFFVWEREMSKKVLDSVLGLEEDFIEKEFKPSPCRQVTIDNENSLIILKLDGVELFKQVISETGREIDMEFIDHILDAWRNEGTELLIEALKI